MPPLVTTAVPRSVPWENLEKSSHFENWLWGHLQQIIWRASQVTSWLYLGGLRVGTKWKWGERGQLVGLTSISSLHTIGVCPYPSRDFGHILWRRWTQKFCWIKETSFFHLVQLSLCTRPSHLGITWGFVRNAISHTLILTWIRFSVLFRVITRFWSNLQEHSSLSSIFLW